MKCFLYLIILACCFSSVTGCITSSDATEIRMVKTIPVLENLTNPFTLRDGERIAGFHLGYDLSDRPLLQTESFTLPMQRLEGAGAEAGICQDGDTHSFGTGSDLLNFIQLIGDTGGDDVSDDADCGCDTRIHAIEFNGLDIRFESGEGIQFAPARIEGKLLLCPNIPEGHHVNGDREFGGPVNAEATLTLRVSPDRLNLLLDVMYHVIETD